METKVEAKSTKSKPAIATIPIRVKRETKKRLIAELMKANKKEFGKRIKADDLISLALSLLQDKHIAELQDQSLSNTDRLEHQRKEFIKQHGPITMDAFLGRLMRGELMPSRANGGAEKANF